MKKTVPFSSDGESRGGVEQETEIRSYNLNEDSRSQGKNRLDRTNREFNETWKEGRNSKTGRQGVKNERHKTEAQDRDKILEEEIVSTSVVHSIFFIQCAIPCLTKSIGSFDLFYSEELHYYWCLPSVFLQEDEEKKTKRRRRREGGEDKRYKLRSNECFEHW